MIMRMIKNNILVDHGCIDCRSGNVIVGIGDGGWWRNDVVVTIDANNEGEGGDEYGEEDCTLHFDDFSRL